MKKKEKTSLVILLLSNDNESYNFMSTVGIANSLKLWIW